MINLPEESSGRFQEAEKLYVARDFMMGESYCVLFICCGLVDFRNILKLWMEKLYKFQVFAAW